MSAPHADPPRWICQLEEPWPWFVTHLTSPVASRAPLVRVPPRARSFPWDARAFPGLDSQGQKRRLPVRFRKRLRIVPRRLPSCSALRVPVTELGSAPRAILELSFAPGPYTPFHSTPITSLARENGDFGRARPNVPGTVESPIHARPKMRAADVCYPQSFKERALTVMCANESIHGFVELPLPQGTARFGSHWRKGAGVVFLASTHTQSSASGTSSLVSAFQTCFRSVCTRWDQSRSTPPQPAWTVCGFHKPEVPSTDRNSG